LLNITGGENSFFAGRQWVFGLLIAAVTGLVIIGGITGIAKVTARLVPAMCMIYIISAIIVLASNIGHIPAAVSMIVTEAFNPRAAVTGGLLAAFVWGMRRATFSNEAGIGSSPIAHAAVKTRMPASEGVCALLEPCVDTVIVCTMTSLVLVTSMYFTGDGGEFLINGKTFQLGDASRASTSFGISMTSEAFQTVHEGFKYILFVCVLLFAFSTLISWSYYGLQAWQYLFGRKKTAALVYKTIFCAVIVAGSAASMDKAVDFSDASLFAMSIPNLIGVYFLLPVIRRELEKYTDYARRVDSGKSIRKAQQEIEAEYGG
jgi:AGCS family alanine or glycine:cation symporter